MGITLVLPLAFVVATLAGLGAALSLPRALSRRILIGRLLISGIAGTSVFVFLIDRSAVPPEEYWRYLWVAAASGYSGPQAMQAAYEKMGLGEEHDTK